MHRRLGNDPIDLSSYLKWLRGQLVEESVLDERDALRLSGAVDEALQNAVLHGNLEVESVLRDHDDGAFESLAEERRSRPPYRDRVVDVTVEWDNVEVRVTVGDEGPGFDIAKLPDPTDPENLFRGHGRGVFMMRAFTDDVRFNARGNQVTLFKRR